MPYIKAQSRQKLDPHIDRLYDEFLGCVDRAKDHPSLDLAGLLNYAMTRLTLRAAGTLGRSYSTIALLAGVHTNVKDEFYARYARPYEDEKIADHGDVYPATGDVVTLGPVAGGGLAAGDLP